MWTASSHLVLVIAAGLLFYAAATDLRAFRIPNEAVLVLAALFFVHAGLSGRWIELHWHLAFAAIASLVMLGCYAQGLMGGGDLKLMAVAFLWTGIKCVLPFLVIMVVFALLQAGAAKMGWVQAQTVEGRMKIALAPSIAAGLIGIFMLGCLAPL
jgi:prepilin peptidase CpaA